MRLLKTRMSEKSISDMNGFADICNDRELSAIVAGCNGNYKGNSGSGSKKTSGG